MAKYGFSTAIPYGTDIFEVTGTEFCEWEDALEKADGDSDAMEWATYDFLINNGYLVSAPTCERPSERGKSERNKKGKGKNSTKEGTTPTGTKPVGVMSPGIRGVPDGFDLISGESREPIWTQSRILTERDKLLKEREKILDIKEKALNQKVVEQQLVERFAGKQKNPPMNKIEQTAWIVIFILFVVGGMIFVVLSKAL